MSRFDVGAMMAFDLETTGTNPKECKIVTSALVSLRSGQQPVKELRLADPGVEIPEAASNVHGITTEMARKDGAPHDQVLAETIAGIRKGWSEGFTLIAFNAAYDLSVLHTQDPSFTVDGLVVDPFVIDKKFDKYRGGKRTLGSVCEHYNVRLDAAHDATEDALAAARLAWMQAKKWPEIAEMDGDELMELQAISYYEDRKSLKDYFENKGRDISDFDLPQTWPMY